MSEHIIGGRREDINITRQIEPKVHSAKDYLKHMPCSSLFPEDRPKIITVEKVTPVSDGFKTLIDHHILSVPVYDSKRSHYTAFIDMLDFVCAIVSSGVGLSSGSFGDLIAGSEKMKKLNCGQVADASKRNLWYPVQENASIGSALHLMVEHRVHRIPIVNSAGELVSIITQSQLVRDLYKHLSKFDIATKTVQELKLGYKDVLSVSVDQKAIEAFHTIFQERVTGLAVVDQSGRLVGNISATDLRNIGADINLISRVFRSVEEYLKLGPKGEQALEKPFCVTPFATFGEVVAEIVSTKAHRIYVVDDQHNPIGVISLGDILEAISHSIH